ncbi:MAG: outer membrane lipoprotein carrier protein LolA [Bacteroidales bacterium]|nr:outer membrane lipoprotein carrier protein LolA [Bacteroidales bacterium]
MKHKTILIIFLFAFFFKASGQSDAEAVKILDSFSSKALAAPSVSMKFQLVTVNIAKGIKDTLNGSVILAKDQYRLELPNNIIWFNGTTLWNYLVAEKEVTITRPDRKDDSFMNRPSSIFTLYKKGYKIRLLEENQVSWVIDLYPEDINSELVRVRLTIGKTMFDLINAEYKRKDGITAFLNVKEYNLKTIPDASFFVFNPKNYRDVEVIDMR